MKQLVLATAAVLACGLASAAPTAAGHGKVIAPPANTGGAAVVCSQSGTDTGTGLASETFTDFTGYNSSGAADCTVTSSHTITEIDTTGVYFNGAGPANSVDITIYKNKKGKPGKTFKAYTGLSYTDATGTGSLHVKVPKTKLKAGTYWIAVQPSQTFGTEGQWGWELQSNQQGLADQWEEDGGLGSGCTKWNTPLSCTGYGGDFMYSATGK